MPVLYGLEILFLGSLITEQFEHWFLINEFLIKHRCPVEFGPSDVNKKGSLSIKMPIITVIFLPIIFTPQTMINEYFLNNHHGVWSERFLPH